MTPGERAAYNAGIKAAINAAQTVCKRVRVLLGLGIVEAFP